MRETEAVPGRPLAFWLALGLVALASYATYVHRVGYPQGFLWDENYHVASAQKYLHGVFFMESHPPLGKLLIALGQRFEPGDRPNAHFIDTDYAHFTPSALDFTWYRLPSAILAALVGPLLFLLFHHLSGRVFFALVLSALYVYDNALIVHSRAAMLEGPLLFFVVLDLLIFLWLLKAKGSPRRSTVLALALGGVAGLAVAVKLLGLIVILLLPALVLGWAGRWREVLRYCALYGVAFVLAQGVVWWMHFALAERVNPQLPEEGTYGLSEEAMEIVRSGRGGSPQALPLLLRESWRYVTQFQEAVPRLDLCNPKENGSPFFYWPLGARTINYRWETPDGEYYRYLYLQGNPLVWACGLVGVLLSTCLLLASWLVPLARPLERPFLLTVFWGFWVSYMVAVSWIERVMYLYHYFIPLVVSLILFGLVVLEVHRFGPWTVRERARRFFLGGLLVAVVGTFQFYRPLTYYELMSDAAVERRALLPLWELRCVRCERERPGVEPCAAKQRFVIDPSGGSKRQPEE